MDDYKISLGAILDANAKGDIDKQLDAIKDLSVTVSNVKLSDSAINDIKAQLSKHNIDLNLVFGNTNQMVNQAKQTGQQIGKLISDGAEQAINKVSSNSIGRYFKIDKSTSNQFRAEMEKLVSEWTNAKGKLTDIKIDTRTSYDKESEKNITRLHQATVTYENELDEVIKKTIAWRQIGTTINAKGEEKILRGFVEVAGQYSKSIDTINTKTDNFIDKQKQAVASARNTLSTIESKLNDKGANKTLANTDFDANGLNQQLDKVKNAITLLENANKNTFTQAKIDVDKEITSLNNLITTLKNAEYAATSLRTKDISTVKIDEKNNLNAFIQKMEQSGHYTDELKQKVSNLKSQLNNVFDANSLTAYLNGLSNLQSEFKAVDAAAKTIEKATKLQTNIDAEKKILKVYTNELKKAGVLTGDVKQKIQDMFHSLSKVDSQNGLATWRTELRGVKAETDAVLKSVTQLSGKTIGEIQALSTGGVQNDYATQIAKLEGNLRSLGLAEETIRAKTQNVKNSLAVLKAEFAKPVDQQNFQIIETANNNLQRELIESTNEVSQLRASLKGMATEQQRLSLANTIKAWNQKNTAATKQVREENDKYIASLENLNQTMTKVQYGNIQSAFKKNENSMRALNRLGATLTNQFKQAVSSFGMWLSASTAVMKVISEAGEAVNELKEVDTLLTEISKTNWNLTSSDLQEIGNNSFGVASKYGKKATNYLSGVKDMSRAGYKNSEEMAELSVAAQGAGDMTAEIANKMVIATDKAYKMNGSVAELTKTLDGVNWICDNNATQMSELSEGMSIVASTAASMGVDVNELTAALGTMSSVTQQSGSEVARAFKAILLNVKQVSDEEEEIDAEGLTKYETACNALGVSLKETKDGILQTRDAMEVLEDLSKEYNKLDENDIRRTNLLNSVGGKLRSTQLDALLRNWDTYKTMLQQFEDGAGTMAVEADKTAKSWE